MDNEISQKDKDRIDNIITVMRLIEECLEVNNIPDDLSQRALELLCINCMRDKNLMDEEYYEKLTSYVLFSDNFNKIYEDLDNVK